MIVLFDTTVLVAALRPAHPAHARCRPWLARVRAGTDVGVLPAHGLAELYANLTRLPLPRQLSPPAARDLIAAELLPHLRLTALTEQEYLTLLNDAAARGVAGATIYDAVIAATGVKAGANRLVTLNPRHFRLVWPGPPAAVVAP